MAEDIFSLSRLSSDHDRSQFSCGVPELDRYLRQQAGQDVRRGLAAVYVLMDREEDRIAGYFSLSATSIEYADLLPEETRKMPRYRALPACLIGRLAVDSDYQGMGLGRLLIVAAFRRASKLRDEIGLLAVIVDAIDDEAAAFYQRLGFRFLGDPTEMRLYQTLSDARDKLWPGSYASEQGRP